MDLQRGQVLWWLSNHLSKQFLWKKCLQDNSLTSSSSPNLHKQTQHSIVLLARAKLEDLFSLSLSHNNLNWVTEIPFTLLLFPELLGGHTWFDDCGDGFSSKLLEIQADAPINWSTDLTKFFNIATDITVFITRTGSTPSAALGKFDNPMIN